MTYRGTEDFDIALIGSSDIDTIRMSGSWILVAYITYVPTENSSLEELRKLCYLHR